MGAQDGRDVETIKKKVRRRRQVPMGHFTGTPDLVYRFILAFHG